MGSGRGPVFSLQPDWRRYAFLAVWEDEHLARDFLHSSVFMQRYHSHASRTSTVIMQTISTHGNWGRNNPFLPVAANLSKSSGQLAVLTRATISHWKLPVFWRQAQLANADFRQADGVLASIGIGEAPFFRQATFSIWESLQAMQQFAYNSPVHRNIIKRTRQEHWYVDDLFARFNIIEQSGSFP